MMNREKAKKLLQMLDRINQELDVLGHMILDKKLKPAPIRVKSRNN